MRVTPALFPSFSKAIQAMGHQLRIHGNKVEGRRWQSVKAHSPMLELLEPSFRVPLSESLDELRLDIRPSLPWADDHFEERVSGIPHNPPPSAEHWPYNPSSFEFREEEVYTHTYPERMWPKEAGNFIARDHRGIRFHYGDLDDVVKLLRKDRHTRQAFLPIWFPEDTGAVHGGRVPCTIGYLFLLRYGRLHITYYIRSCDYFRHFRDDIYLTARLALWMNEATSLASLAPGFLNMHIGSFHCWYQEKEVLPDATSS